MWISWIGTFFQLQTQTDMNLLEAAKIPKYASFAAGCTQFVNVFYLADEVVQKKSLTKSM